MTPPEVTAIRKLFGTRKRFHAATRFSEDALYRWEHGRDNPPAKSSAMFLRVIRDVPGVAEYLLKHMEEA